MKKRGNQVQIVHAELEKVLNKKFQDKFQESDMIELLDGSAVKLLHDTSGSAPKPRMYVNVEITTQ